MTTTLFRKPSALRASLRKAADFGPVYTHEGEVFNARRDLELEAHPRYLPGSRTMLGRKVK